MSLLNIKTMDERLANVGEKSQVFKDRAEKHDKDGTFPHDNFKELKEIGYPALMIPKKYGGLEISLYELVRLQELLGKVDGSTALSIGWHMGITMQLREKCDWKESVYEEFVKNVVLEGALINNILTERSTGSPTRGGKPETIAIENDKGWVINGRKTFATMAPILDYLIVSATIEGTDKVGNFLIRSKTPGLKMEETWDSIAMRATGSHDIILDNVRVNEDAFLHYVIKKKQASGWLLHIPACYLGIARAAQEYAVRFATTYSPSTIDGMISEIPTVKQKIGEMELFIIQSEHFLYSTARKWDTSNNEIKEAMQSELSAVKLSVVNNALKVVDLAMRIVGARSLSEQNPLQRYYRDIRAGLHNPPMDDMTIMQLATSSIAQYTEKKVN